MVDKGLKWLEDHVEDAAKGLDAAVEDMIKSVKPYIEVLRQLSSSTKPLYADDLQKRSKLPQPQISKGLGVLQQYKLVAMEGECYTATDFGKHALNAISS